MTSYRICGKRRPVFLFGCINNIVVGVAVRLFQSLPLYDRDIYCWLTLILLRVLRGISDRAFTVNIYYLAALTLSLASLYVYFYHYHYMIETYIVD